MQTNSTSLAGVTPRLSLLTVRETPAYRIAADPSVCTNVELLAALIGGPKQLELADAVLAYFNGDLGRLCRASVTELVSIAGIGEATAARLRSAFVLSRRLTMTQSEHTPVTTPEKAAALCADMETFDVEHLRAIMLNVKFHVLDVVDVYKGSANSLQIRTSEVFRLAIRCNAVNVILAHNHPSGDPTPSSEDATMTRVFIQAGKLLDIDVLEHIVVGHGSWVSLKERGLGFV
jgi:DNA repair protein RadC